jgi:hypothetical protein
VTDEKITESDVRKEHLREINQPAHWGYLFGVLIGGLGLMVLLMAAFGSAS